MLGTYIGGELVDLSWDSERERLAVGRASVVSVISCQVIFFDGFE